MTTIRKRPGRRGAVRALVAAVGAGVIALAVAPVSYASDQLRVQSASGVSEAPGFLQVTAESGSDITEVEAHLVSYATGAQVAELGPGDFALASGTAANGTWRSKQPLALDKLGIYRIDVELTDADGDHVEKKSAGDFGYWAATRIGALTVDRTSIDRGHREVTVQGTLYGNWPAQAEKPLAGYPVDIDVDYWPQTTVTTDADGRFTATVTLDQATGIQAFYRYDNQHPGYVYSESELLQIGIDQIPTRFVTDVSATDIDDGDPVTLTAKAEQQTADGSWVPLAGQSGGILFGDPDGQSDFVERFTTAADGTFSTTYTPWDRGRFLLALDTSEDPFLAPASAQSALVHVHHAAAFTAFSATRTDAAAVHVEGLIDFTDGFTPATILVHVQYSADGTRWSDLTTVEAYWGGNGSDFAADVEGSGPGHYRAVFEGGDSFQDAVTESVFVDG
ncbi:MULTISPECIES: hypothetical protein [unclassified Streptomyces]|uniref:hypothetical protein n=1 Tax=unclassified Streptomyces TaxID=2593676 RepID=UPI002475D170|nr:MULTISPECIES: hypothetical protein [unclassified Streptomyces]MDH6451796.1 hypothetical protein [Streptomyces sp. SAI-119]MDH6497647.1 hypothetical protein [Streptomyces sp. SAI-149]